MIELHIDSVIFTFLVIIFGILYGQYCFTTGIKFGQKELANDLFAQGIIDFDDSGEIIPRND